MIFKQQHYSQDGNQIYHDANLCIKLMNLLYSVGNIWGKDAYWLNADLKEIAL